MSELKAGLSHSITIEVTPEVLAPRFVPGTPEVFGTPAMLALIERTAKEAVDPYLAEGESTVGTAFKGKHLAATPPGVKVTCTVRLVEVDRARLAFAAEVHDEVEKIGEADHERFIINLEKFRRRVAGKGK